METIYSVFVLLLVPRLGHTQPQTDVTCGPAPPPSTQVAPVYTDLRLDGFQVSHLMGFTLERCVLECFLVKMCESFNYREHLGVCALNNVTASAVDTEHLVNATNFVYHELQAWSDFQTMAGTCASKPCAENQRCIQTEPVHTCVLVDCGPPPNYILGKSPSRYYVTSAQTVTSLGNRAHYSCNDPWVWDRWELNYDVPFYNSNFKICNSDYTWSKNTPECWARVRTCEEIRDCNPDNGDKHYLIKYGDGNPNHIAIIYCHNMTGTVKTFLTRIGRGSQMASGQFSYPFIGKETFVINSNEVPASGNFADGGDAAGTNATVYSKIRISQDFIVDPSDRTFATSSHFLWFDYGKVMACPGTRFFSVNLAGTGLGINPETAAWTSNMQAVVTNLYTSSTLITGQCYAAVGQCGECYQDPTTPLRLTWVDNPTQAVDGSEAKQPVCPTSLN